MTRRLKIYAEEMWCGKKDEWNIRQAAENFRASQAPEIATIRTSDFQTLLIQQGNVVR